MGGAVGKAYSWRALSEFDKCVHFNMTELEALHHRFEALAAKTPEHPHEITLEQVGPHITTKAHQFREALNFVKLPERDSSAFLEQLFKHFDRSNTGTINYREYVSGLSALGRGTLNERIHLAFAMYDLRGDGFIHKDEMMKVIVAMHDVLTLTHNSQTGDKLEDIQVTPEHHKEIMAFVEKTFEEADDEKNNLLSFDEFYRACKHNPVIIQYRAADWVPGNES